ncbi:MAG: hypothetical protein ACK5CQ_03845, partial [Cyanobacteriota bacterium]
DFGAIHHAPWNVYPAPMATAPSSDQPNTTPSNAELPIQVANLELLSWLDVRIAEAAIRSRCSILFSQDFSHGRRIAGLVVINPLAAPSQGVCLHCSGGSGPPHVSATQLSICRPG